MKAKTARARRIAALLATRTDLHRAGTGSPLERAWAAAVNARDHAHDRHEAMDWAHTALDAIDELPHSDGYLLRSGPLAEAKEKWGL